MRRVFLSMLWLLTPCVLLMAGAHASAASLGVRDDAHFFSADAIAQANAGIQQINQQFHKDLLIETLAEIPQDLQAEYQQQGKDRFYRSWAASRSRRLGVNGVYVVITRKPPHLQVWDTQAGGADRFAPDDANQLSRQLAGAFGQKQYDQGLSAAVEFVQQRMAAQGGAATGRMTPYGASPPSRTYPGPVRTNFNFGGIACVIIGVILFIILIRGVFGRSGGSYGAPGGYYPPGGGYAPPGGYGGYGYGRGGGMGQGFLGGLLGGALGGYAADKWFGQGQGQGQGGGFIPPSSGGDIGGGGFGSGADFGSGDSGGGGDFGGGGGGGADFGGGGGGDSGGSGGSDF